MPQTEFTESLEWLTDVIRCKGKEQRIALRPQARQELVLSHVLDDQNLARAKALARFASASEILVPGWESFTRVGTVAAGAQTLNFSTAYAPYRVGDQVVVWQEVDYFEVRTLTAVAANQIDLDAPLARSYSLALVMPVRPSRFAQDFEATRGAGWHDGSVRFVSTQYRSLEGSGAAPAYPVYRGHDVLTDRTVRLSDIRERFVREADTFDGGLGKIWTGSEFNYPIQGSQAAWSLDTRAALWPIRAWLDARRGRQVGFWMPSWNVDLVLTTPTLTTSTTITVRSVGFSSYNKTGDIMILTTAGTMYFRRVINSAPGSPGFDVLQLESAIGVALQPSQIQAICLMTFNRLDADRIEIKHRAARGADIAVAVMEAPLP
ncbi:hypothetical protein P9A47_gp40 [Xanthomonas phage Elanor]|uniref:Uncharacterized protein n=1 Tax=Xanthomonas phage Elanor TaxID=2939127 RepID=A0A9E7E1R0_9CAUD|nr:hypothetical protein P9A47_gp40 [Xanthomonas phage Elanor]URA07008.1 hypothetical protein Elanor_BL40040 [Xanthomonas phage Elanor]